MTSKSNKIMPILSCKLLRECCILNLITIRRMYTCKGMTLYHHMSLYKTCVKICLRSLERPTCCYYSRIIYTVNLFYVWCHVSGGRGRWGGGGGEQTVIPVCFAQKLFYKYSRCPAIGTCLSVPPLHTQINLRICFFRPESMIGGRQF